MVCCLLVPLQSHKRSGFPISLKQTRATCVGSEASAFPLQVLNRQQFMTLIEYQRKQAPHLLSEQEAKILRGSLDFSTMTAKSIMVPMTDTREDGKWKRNGVSKKAKWKVVYSHSLREKRKWKSCVGNGKVEALKMENEVKGRLERSEVCEGGRSVHLIDMWVSSPRFLVAFER